MSSRNEFNRLRDNVTEGADPDQVISDLVVGIAEAESSTSEKCVDCASPKVLPGTNLCSKCARKRGRSKVEAADRRMIGRTSPKDVTASQIRDLSTAAAEAGDLEMVAVCKKALGGNARARAEVARVINDAAAQESVHEARNFDGNRDDQGEILEGIARAAFVSAYADGIESGELDGDSASGGDDWMDVAPEHGASSRRWAKKIARDFEVKNGMPLWSLFARAAAAPGKHAEPPDDPAVFGHYLAMRVMGHGVSWEDDHPDIKIKYPHSEYSWMDDAQLSKLAKQEDREGESDEEAEGEYD